MCFKSMCLKNSKRDKESMNIVMGSLLNDVPSVFLLSDIIDLHPAKIEPYFHSKVLKSLWIPSFLAQEVIPLDGKISQRI